ncbi:hypothetical protein [Microbacterium telephonicum]|uniref:Phage Mu protein F like protein n=1 Tax=Microbacterium telephonicum TaxID=1714841 RepID=A0A498BZ67_9MICO|nr:hypothetical protein [Microbacterium telephonicum]RLK47626.1 hypothetical protein C7474_2218 [Microbacterium telephonicum]
MVELTPDRLTAAYMAQVAAVRDRVLAYAVAMWGSATSLRDADVERLVARIVPVVQGGQVQVAGLTNAYVGQLAKLEGVTVVTPPVDRAAVVGYRGVPAEEVYRRPAVETYTALRDGKPFGAAREVGLGRLKSLVTTDVQQARNRQSREAYSGTGFDYTIRTLSGSENCALCVIASTQRYHAGGLMPIHPGCDCGERGVRAGRDPGQVVDQRLLDLTYEQVDSKLASGDPSPELGEKKTSAGKPISDLTDMIVTREHGELGATLAWRQDHFTGPSDIH